MVERIVTLLLMLLLPLYMPGTSAKKHRGTELCSILNRALREDDPAATVHAAAFANAINLLLLGDGPPQSWLRQVFEESFMYVIGAVGEPLCLCSLCHYHLELCDT